MKRASLAMVICCAPLSAHAAVDWKLYGGADMNGLAQYCFYDAKSISYEKDNVRIWVKCLSKSELDGVKPKNDSTYAARDAAAHRIARGYMPPLDVISPMKLDQIETTIIYETEANALDIRPEVSIYYEIDCQERRERELSLSLKNDDHNSAPLAWSYVPPEGNGAMLLSLICPKR